MKGFSFFSSRKRTRGTAAKCEEPGDAAASVPTPEHSDQRSRAVDSGRATSSPGLRELEGGDSDPTPQPESKPAAKEAAAHPPWSTHRGDALPRQNRGLRPGSDGEHQLQCRYGSNERADGFYTRQVLDFLSPLMQDFIARQEILIVGTADRHGECDCTSKFGQPGFIRVLDDKYLIYPEYRGNGVFANLGNITENPHIAMLILDLYRDSIGLHVNGKARIVENEELLGYRDHLPDEVVAEISLEGKKRPERWVMVEVEEAYIQCSKHIPLMKKLDKRIEWGTDNVVTKGGDYFKLQDIPLYERVGGDKAMDLVVDVFYRKVLQDELVGKFFEDVDMEAQRLKQKSFLAMAFGGPYRYEGQELRAAHRRLVRELGMTDAHFDRVIAHFRDSVTELHVPDAEVRKMCEILETFRDDVLDR